MISPTIQTKIRLPSMNTMAIVVEQWEAVTVPALQAVGHPVFKGEIQSLAALKAVALGV
jgi:hypothetical protein